MGNLSRARFDIHPIWVTYQELDFCITRNSKIINHGAICITLCIATAGYINIGHKISSRQSSQINTGKQTSH